MQIDMHYYGTFALARAAGLNINAARMIATCAQFVDDNAAGENLEFANGAMIFSEATAHHPIDRANLELEDQRDVWVPFHFIPGNEGNDYTERLKCRKDSAVAQSMRDHHVSLAYEPFALALIGIAAHVYGDTFSHYGFSGVSSRGNKVVNNSFEFDDGLDPEIKEYIAGKARTFFDIEPAARLLQNIKSHLVEKVSGALGHGSVATYPDRPYLIWKFDYEREDAVSGIRSTRRNPETFLEGCEALYKMFSDFLALQPHGLDAGDGRPFDSIRGTIRNILSVQGSKEARIEAWQQAAGDGLIFGKGSENIPEYAGRTWNKRWESLNGAETHEAAMDEPVWHFYQAASIHRNFVLRELLPHYGLVVS